MHINTGYINSTIIIHKFHHHQSTCKLQFLAGMQINAGYTIFPLKKQKQMPSTTTALTIITKNNFSIALFSNLHKLTALYQYMTNILWHFQLSHLLGVPEQVYQLCLPARAKDFHGNTGIDSDDRGHVFWAVVHVDHILWLWHHCTKQHNAGNSLLPWVTFIFMNKITQRQRAHTLAPASLHNTMQVTQTAIHQ